MPTKQSAEPTPDLFSATPKLNASEFSVIPQAKAVTDNMASQSRYLLPKDLTEALKRLDDTEVDTLLTAVMSEAKRRGRLPRTRLSKTAISEDCGGFLTKGKLNAVRAAFKAGVKPSTIARQFGISQSNVRKALATEGQDRK
jgi:hypothetical protein